jgi:hypothetical protein
MDVEWPSKKAKHLFRRKNAVAMGSLHLVARQMAMDGENPLEPR